MRTLNAPAWLTARPIAHRGLHDKTRRIVENTPGAAKAAIAADYAIECDVQLSRDGEAVVFHDDRLGRLTRARGPVAKRTAAELAAVVFRDSDGRIPTLAGYLGLIAGRVPLICEIKSAFDGDLRLADRVLLVAAGYAGPLAFKSFDPEVIALLRKRGARQPLGIVAERRYADFGWTFLGRERKFSLSNFLHFSDTQPDFLSFWFEDLPSAVPLLCRAGMGMPVMSWTIRTPGQRDQALRHADQIVFEGFAP